MNILRKALIAIVLLLVVVLVWIGGSIYYQKSGVDINPNAQSYMKPLKSNFEIEEVQKLSSRTESSFPITPSEFLVLTEGN